MKKKEKKGVHRFFVGSDNFNLDEGKRWKLKVFDRIGWRTVLDQ